MESNTTERELITTSLLNAPINLVWEAWTKPEYIKNWWGPNGFTNTIYKMDVAPGGEWEFTMHGPDGSKFNNRSMYREITPHEKIVFDHISAPKFTATVTFTPQGNKTLINWHMLFETKELFEQVVKVFKADEGQKQNIERLNAYLAQLQQN